MKQNRKEAAARMAGIVMMMCSVFLLIAGCYTTQTILANGVRYACIAAGLLLLVAGTVCYRVLSFDKNQS